MRDGQARYSLFSLPAAGGWNLLRLEGDDFPRLPNGNRFAEAAMSVECLFDGRLHPFCDPVSKIALAICHFLPVDSLPDSLIMYHRVSTCLALSDQYGSGRRVIKDEPAIRQRQIELPEILKASSVPAHYDILWHIVTPFGCAEPHSSPGETGRLQPHIDQYNGVALFFQLLQKGGESPRCQCCFEREILPCRGEFVDSVQHYPSGIYRNRFRFEC